MNQDRLDSWKEISEYLKRDIRTCTRWKNLYSLPVHKIDERSAYSRVFAYKSEIDKWLKVKTNNHYKYSLLTNKWTYIVLVCLIVPFLSFYLYINSNHSSPDISTGLSTLAVFPIENLEESPHLDYICEGITNEIINRLLLINDLKVIPYDYEEMKPDITKNQKNIKKLLGAEYLLKGKTINQNKEVCILLELMNASDHSKVWEKKFDSPEKNITHIIESTYLKITELLDDEDSDMPFLGSYIDNDSIINYLKGEYILNNMKKEDSDPWKLYTSGKYLTGKCTPESNEIAIDFFNKAIEIDSHFALPYIGLAQCYSNYVNFEWDFDRKWVDKAESFLNKARSLSSDYAEFYSTAIEVKLVKLVGYGEDNTAQIEMLVKEGTDKYHYHAQLNSIVGYWYFLKFGEKGDIQNFKKALEYKENSYLLSPASFNNIVYAELLMLNKEFDKALDVCKQMERNNPSSFTKFRLGEIYYYMGDLDKSSFIFHQFENANLKLKIDSLFFLSMILSRMGERDKVHKTIKRIELLSPENTTKEDDLKLASIHFGLNEKESGYEHLKKHFENIPSKYNYYIDWKYTEIDKNFDNVRNEKRFKTYMKGENNGKEN